MGNQYQGRYNRGEAKQQICPAPKFGQALGWEVQRKDSEAKPSRDQKQKTGGGWDLGEVQPGGDLTP